MGERRKFTKNCEVYLKELKKTVFFSNSVRVALQHHLTATQRLWLKGSELLQSAKNLCCTIHNRSLCNTFGRSSDSEPSFSSYDSLWNKFNKENDYCLVVFV